MDVPLRRHLSQRALLLGSDEADLGLLKRHDRSLLVAMERSGQTSTLLQQAGAEQVLMAALKEDLIGAVVILEARARLWPGELRRIQALLLSAPDAAGAAWWLAAHYPALCCPTVFPKPWQDQFWAAQAMRRRGMAASLPEPWFGWAQVLGSSGGTGLALALPVVKALWHASERDWKPWLAPLLTITDQNAAVGLVNWLARHLEDRSVIEVMGLSCQSCFLPWLESVGEDPDLAEAARREVQWLTANNRQRHDGRQCWGAPMTPKHFYWLFQRLPLGFRGRLWPWCNDAIQGAANSLQGGAWCAGE